MRPDFSKIDFREIKKGGSSGAGGKGTGDWMTPEAIPVPPVFTKDDLNGLEHLNYAAGIAPFLSGPYSSMYVTRPWTIRQYAGFSTAEESNAFIEGTWPRGKRGCP